MTSCLLLYFISGDRRPHPFAARDRGALAFGEQRWRTDLPAQRQRPRSSCTKALLSWILAQGIDTALIEPGKPWQNGVAESFNGKFRDECLSLEWFRTRAEAKPIIERWHSHYNEVRPHSSLGYLTPNEFMAQRANAASRHATGRVAAVSGPPRPGPLRNPPSKGYMEQARDAVSS